MTVTLLKRSFVITHKNEIDYLNTIVALVAAFLFHHVTYLPPAAEFPLLQAGKEIFLSPAKPIEWQTYGLH
jgi:hypothetical protein